MFCSQCNKEFRPKVKYKIYEANGNCGFIKCPHCDHEHHLNELKFLRLFRFLVVFILIFIANTTSSLIGIKSIWIDIGWALIVGLIGFLLYNFISIKVYCSTKRK